jgi:hypothetical protein
MLLRRDALGGHDAIARTRGAVAGLLQVELTLPLRVPNGQTHTSSIL